MLSKAIGEGVLAISTIVVSYLSRFREWNELLIEIRRAECDMSIGLFFFTKT